MPWLVEREREDGTWEHVCEEDTWNEAIRKSKLLIAHCRIRMRAFNVGRIFVFEDMFDLEKQTRNLIA